MGKKGKKEEVAEETPDQIEWRNLKNEADRLHKQTKKEEHDFNEFQQQREKLNYFWIVEKKKLEERRAWVAMSLSSQALGSRTHRQRRI